MVNPSEMFIVDRKYRVLKVYPKVILNYKSPYNKPQIPNRIINIFDGELIIDRHKP